MTELVTVIDNYLVFVINLIVISEVGCINAIGLLTIEKEISCGQKGTQNLFYLTSH